jgi:glycoside/pentoside/hexuronide:cation symporter, GPH family
MDDHSDPFQPTTHSKLKFATKLAYGVGDFGPALVANVLIFFLLYFLINVAGLDPGLAGSILLIANVWDAINDPIIGVLTDRTRSQWGRRLPWIIGGAIPFGITFFLQWIVPVANQWLLFAYYIAIALLSNTLYTIVNLPYTALTAELTQDYHERTSLNGFRFSFSLLGGMVALGLVLAIFGLIPEAKSTERFIWIGIVGGVVATVPLFLCVWGIWQPVLRMEQQRQSSLDGDGIPLGQQFIIVLNNRPFLFVIGIYLFAWLAFQNTAAILPFFVVNYLKLTESVSTTAAIFVQGAALLCLPLWTLVSQKFSKQGAYWLGISIWMIAQVGLYILSPGQMTWVYPLSALAGCGISTAFLIPWSMLPDVIEWNELNTGQRREGLFYGFMTLAQKVCRGFGLFLIGLALKQTGFIERTAGQPIPIQPEGAKTAILYVTTLLPIVLLVISLMLIYFYPISREIHGEIVLHLQEKRRIQQLKN